MALRLPGERLRHSALDAARLAQRTLQVDLVVAEQAGAELPVGRQPHPVAAFAVVVGEGRDHAHRPRAVREAVVHGGPVPPRSRVRQEILDRADLLEHFVRRDETVGEVEVLPHRHEFDEAHVPRPLARDLGEVDDLVVVEAPHDDAVDLDRREARILGGAEAFHRLVETARGPPGDLLEPVAVERVEADVHAGDASFPEGRRETGQEDGVRGERDVVDARNRGDHAHEVRQVLADERLSPGDADAFQPERGHLAHDLGNLFVREHLRLGDPREPLLRHAVRAA